MRDEPSADTTQEIPTAVDTVYFKWRFYFQGISDIKCFTAVHPINPCARTDFDEAVHYPTIHLEWQVRTTRILIATSPSDPLLYARYPIPEGSAG